MRTGTCAPDRDLRGLDHRSSASGLAPSVPVAFKWATENANAGWIGGNTSNATVGGFSTIATAGSLSLSYQCSEASARYTLTFEGQDGIVNATITLRR